MGSINSSELPGHAKLDVFYIPAATLMGLIMGCGFASLVLRFHSLTVDNDIRIPRPVQLIVDSGISQCTFANISFCYVSTNCSLGTIICSVWQVIFKKKK